MSMPISIRVNLPVEILFEILSRLPAKSLGRFKCVSKSFRNLISDPQFIKTHIKNRPSDEKLILISRDLSLYSVEFDYNNEVGFATKLKFGSQIIWIEVVGSCNGLILVADESDTMFLLNPTTLKSMKLPISLSDLESRSSRIIMWGLGVDSSTDDYKVVTVSYYHIDNRNHTDCKDVFVHVYMPKTNAWRKLQNSPYNHARSRPMSGIFLKGSLHWLAKKLPNYSSVIAAFDLTREKFSEVPPPTSLDSDICHKYDLVILGGCLCILVACKNNIQTVVWMMKEYGVADSWIKFSIFERDLAIIQPLHFLGNKQVLLECNAKELVIYNIEDEKLKVMVVSGIPPRFRAEWTYVESLVSPNCNNAFGEQQLQQGTSAARRRRGYIPRLPFQQNRRLCFYQRLHTRY